MATKDYYATLGVDRGADADTIKKTFRKLALKYHPDRNENDKAAEERFKEINEAYAVLSDADKRKQYDMYGAEGFGQRYSTEDIFNNFDFGSIFSDLGIGGGFRSMFGGRGARAAPQAGQSVTSPLTIGFHEALQGGERSLSLQGPNGPETISVRIPKGITSGKKLRVKAHGQPGRNGGPRGDLFLEIRVADHPNFKLEGIDLHTTVRLPVTTLLLGGAVEIETAVGESKTLQISPRTDPGKKVRLRGEGFTALGGKVGDLYATLALELPEEFTPQQLEQLEALRESGL